MMAFRYGGKYRHDEPTDPTPLPDYGPEDLTTLEEAQARWAKEDEDLLRRMVTRTNGGFSPIFKTNYPAEMAVGDWYAGLGKSFKYPGADPVKFARGYVTGAESKRRGQSELARTPWVNRLFGKPRLSDPTRSGWMAAGRPGGYPWVPYGGTGAGGGTSGGGTTGGGMIPGVTSRADLEDMLNRIFGGGAGGGGTGASDEVIKNIEEQGRNAKRDLRAQADKDKESLMANFASRGILSSGLARGAEIDLLSGLYRALGGVDTDIMRAVADARLRQEQFDRTQGLAERQADWGLLKDFFNWLGVTPSQGGAAAPTSQNAASPYYVYPGTERQVSYPQGVTARSAPAAALPTPTPAAAPQRTSDPRLVRNESPFGGWRETGRVERGVNEPTSLIGTALSKMKESQWLRLQRLAEDINNERLSRGQPPLSTTDIMERVWIDQGTRAFPRTPNTTTAAGGRTPDEALTMGAKALRTLAAPFLDVLRAFSPYPKPLDPNANPLMPGA